MRYKISDLAKLLDVSTNTVRRYEDRGIYRLCAMKTVDTGIMMMMGYSAYLMLKCM